MKTRRTLICGIIAASAMLVMILDTKTAIASAQEGITLCTRSIIPSLFPFFVLSGVINSCLLGQKLGLLRPVGQLCKIPKGAESLLLLGLFAGYPIGAQFITQAYREGTLSKNDARRMLGFCNNAGPAFLFGMLTPLFSRLKTVWILWAIHILSALITGYALPARSIQSASVLPSADISFSNSLQKAVKATAGVCGWVIVFRVVLGFCNRWFFWLLPISVQVIFSGLLELSNGCNMLQNIPCEGVRFLLAGIMLSFGGLCVGMQTTSVTDGLGTGWYFPGKVLQTTFTVLFSLILQPLLFPDSFTIPLHVYIGLAAILPLFILSKKVVAFPRRLLYNTDN